MESNAEKETSHESKLSCKDGLGKTMGNSDKETSDNFDDREGEGQGKLVSVVQSGPYFLNKNDNVVQNENRQMHILENQGGANPSQDEVLLLSQKNTDPVPVAFETKEIPNLCMSNEITDQSNSDVDEKKMVSQQDENINYFEDMRKFERSSKDSEESLKGPMGWIVRQMSNDVDPKNVISQIMPGVSFPHYVDPMNLWKVVWEILTEPKPRHRLEHINVLDDVVKLISSCKKILILTGAGVSVSCGIPDFRSRDGIYARLSKDFPDLPDPQSMFDIHYFRRDQRPFFKFAKEIYPGSFTPSLSHRFIAALDRRNKLLHNYTQNIDTLEQQAGIERVIQCHGSFATASCTNCKYQVKADEIRDKIFNQIIPKCPVCPEDENVLAVMKPDIIFFGEGLPNVFYENLDTDKNEADLLIVIGSSLKVRPVALLPDYLKPGVPQILINREPLNHFNFDVELLGNCDDVICEICRRLGDDWNDVTQGHEVPPLDKEALYKILESLSDSDVESADSCDVAMGIKDGEEKMEEADSGTVEEKDGDINTKGFGTATWGSTGSQPSDFREDPKTAIEDICTVSSGLADEGKCLETKVESSGTCSENVYGKDDDIKHFCINEEKAPSEDCIGDRTYMKKQVQKHENDNIDENVSAMDIANSSLDQNKDTDNSDENFKDNHEDDLLMNERKRPRESIDIHSGKDIANLGEGDSVGESKRDSNDEEIREVESQIEWQSTLATDLAVKDVYSALTTSSGTDTCIDNENRTKRVKLDHSATKELNESSTGGVKQDSNYAGEGFKNDTSDHHPKELKLLDSYEDLDSELIYQPKSPKYSKGFLLHEMEEQDMHYLFVPPNRYIFHGAEINSSFAIQQRLFDFGSDIDDEDDNVDTGDKTRDNDLTQSGDTTEETENSLPSTGESTT